MKVLVIINSLDRGGAEMNLLRLARALRDDMDITILPLRGSGELTDLARCQGINVLPAGLASLCQCWLRPPAPVVEGWLYAGSLVANLFRWRGCTVVWNFRHVPVDLACESLLTRLCLRLLRRLPKPRRIHVNSGAAVDAHVTLGIQGEYRVIPNGIDTAQYQNDPAAATALRRSLGVSDDATVIVNVGRAHPHKGHRVLFEALAPLLVDHPRVHLACFGRGVPGLMTLATDLGLPSAQVHLHEALDDVVSAFSAAAIVVNASLTESSPTVVAEAMSCGAVCVATDVGATAELLGEAGILVPAGDVAALSRAVWETLSLAPNDREIRSQRARRRIVEAYGAAKCSATYFESIAQIASAR